MMAEESSYQPLRLEQLLFKLEGAVSALEGLGPYTAEIKPQQWLLQIAAGVLEEVEDNLPDADFFRSITSTDGKNVRLSQLAKQVTCCWELLFIMSIGRAAIMMFIRESTPKMGFAPKQGKST